MDRASEAILGLEPVTFRYKPELDPEAIPQFGLVAEQVAKVNPDLVARDAEGKVFTVRYEEINAMLLNEFLKEHRRNDAQAAAITELRAALARRQRPPHWPPALTPRRAALGRWWFARFVRKRLARPRPGRR